MKGVRKHVPPEVLTTEGQLLKGISTRIHSHKLSEVLETREYITILPIRTTYNTLNETAAEPAIRGDY